MLDVRTKTKRPERRGKNLKKKRGAHVEDVWKYTTSDTCGTGHEICVTLRRLAAGSRMGSLNESESESLEV